MVHYNNKAKIESLKNIFYFTRKYVCRLFIMYVWVYHTDSKMPESIIRAAHYGKKTFII